MFYSNYARTWVFQAQTARFRFGYQCNSSLIIDGGLYNVLCKYHPFDNDSKDVPKRSGSSTYRCFAKVYNTSEYHGVSNIISK